MEIKTITKEEFKETRAYSFLAGQSTLILSTVDENRNPHSAVLYYFVNGAGKICFITKTSTKKFTNLSSNTKVALLIYDEPERKTLQMSGVAEIIEDSNAQEEIFDHLATIRKAGGGNWMPPVAELKEGNFVSIAVDPKEVSFVDYKEIRSGKDTDLFDKFKLAN